MKQPSEERWKYPPKLHELDGRLRQRRCTIDAREELALHFGITADKLQQDLNKGLYHENYCE